MDNEIKHPDIIKNSVILIVDDIDENLEILGNILTAQEYKVSFASSGRQALKIAESIFPDIILLDISMPDMDGYEVLSLLKKNEATRQIPVIFITAKTEIEDLIKGFNAGCVDYITKPFNGSELLARVSTHLELKKTKEDIEVRKAVEKQLVVAKERAEELERLKTALLSNLSHEFRTPLIGILGYTELLAETIQDPDDFDMIQSISESGHRLLTTLNSVLRLSELQAGNLKADLQEMEINPVVSKVTDLFCTEIRRKGLTLNMNLSPENPSGVIDPGLFEQVLIYLIDNAVKYTDRGRIYISTAAIADLSVRGTEVVISDSGIGLDIEHLEKIFEEFRQGSEGYSRDYDGIGLGLTLSKKMLDLMSGKIDVESTQGAGTVFKISLPAPSL